MENTSGSSDVQLNKISKMGGLHYTSGQVSLGSSMRRERKSNTDKDRLVIKRVVVVLSTQTGRNTAIVDLERDNSE